MEEPHYFGGRAVKYETGEDGEKEGPSGGTSSTALSTPTTTTTTTGQQNKGGYGAAGQRSSIQPGANSISRSISKFYGEGGGAQPGNLTSSLTSSTDTEAVTAMWSPAGPEKTSQLCYNDGHPAIKLTLKDKVGAPSSPTQSSTITGAGTSEGSKHPSPSPSAPTPLSSASPPPSPRSPASPKPEVMGSSSEVPLKREGESLSGLPSKRPRLQENGATISSSTLGERGDPMIIGEEKKSVVEAPSHAGFIKMILENPVYPSRVSFLILIFIFFLSFFCCLVLFSEYFSPPFSFFFLFLFSFFFLIDWDTNLGDGRLLPWVQKELLRFFSFISLSLNNGKILEYHNPKIILIFFFFFKKGFLENR